MTRHLLSHDAGISFALSYTLDVEFMSYLLNVESVYCLHFLLSDVGEYVLFCLVLRSFFWQKVR